MTTSEIAEFLNGELIGNPNAEIRRLAALESAAENELAFVENPKIPFSSAAECLLISDQSETADFADSAAVIKVRNPKLAFARIAARLYRKEVCSKWHDSASIAENSDVRAAHIGEFVVIGSNCFVAENVQLFAGVKIGSRVSIGKNTIIHPNCVIYDNVTIGTDVILHAGTIVGADGFGYVRDGASGYIKFPQIGTVIIEDNVEIGANSCIDRGALGATKIGSGTKLDNQVQVAHNVQIGQRVVIAAQTGISGSTVIEDDCVIGGQVGIGDHARVSSGAVIGSQAGVLPGKIVRRGVWWGTPVQPLEDYKRHHAHLKGVARLKAEIKELKTQIALLLNKEKF